MHARVLHMWGSLIRSVQWVYEVDKHDTTNTIADKYRDISGLRIRSDRFSTWFAFLTSQKRIFWGRGSFIRGLKASVNEFASFLYFPSPSSPSSSLFFLYSFADASLFSRDTVEYRLRKRVAWDYHFPFEYLSLRASEEDYLGWTSHLMERRK